METPNNVKDAALDSMSKDELVKKYKRLLAIAQKAKQSKDECSEELKRVKENEIALQSESNAIRELLIEVQESNPFLFKNVSQDNHVNLKEFIDSSKRCFGEKCGEITAVYETLTKLNMKISELEIRTSEDAIKLTEFTDVLTKLEKEKSDLLVKNSELTNKLRNTEEKYAILDTKLVEFQDKYIEGKKQQAKLQSLLEKLEEKSSNPDRSDSRDSLQPVLENKEIESMCEKVHELHLKIEKLEASNKSLLEGNRERDILKEELNACEERCKTLEMNHSKIYDTFWKRWKDIVVCYERVRCDYTEKEQQLIALLKEKDILQSQIKSQAESTEDGCSTLLIDERKGNIVRDNSMCEPGRDDIFLYNKLEIVLSAITNFKIIRDQQGKDLKDEFDFQESSNKDAELSKTTIINDKILIPTKYEEDFAKTLNSLQNALRTLRENYHSTKALTEQTEKINFDIEEKPPNGSEEISVSELKDEVQRLKEINECILREKNEQEETLLTQINENIKDTDELKKQCSVLMEANRVFEEGSRHTEEMASEIKNLKEQLTNLKTAYEKVCEDSDKEKQELASNLSSLNDKYKFLEAANQRLVTDGNKVNDLKCTIGSLQQQLEEVRNENKRADLKYNEMEARFADSKNMSEGLEIIVKQQCEEYDKFKYKVDEYDTLKEKVRACNDLIFQLQRLQKDVSNVKISFQSLKLDVMSEVEATHQSNGFVTNSVNQVVGDFVQNLVKANSELLNEMNMMNQELKERGETISKMEENIANWNSMSSESDVKIKKLSERLDTVQDENGKLRGQVEVRDKSIRDMEEEIWRLRGQDATCETLSTSTISRVEESTRLMDVEDGFEDRYNKLKVIAVKLKKKVAELQHQVEQEKNKLIVERAEFEAKVSQFQTQGRTLNALQMDYDKLQDQCGADRRETNELRKALDKAREESIACKKSIEEMKQEREKFKQEKMSFDIIKKELSGQIQSLKKTLEKEQNKVKEFDKVREKYEQDIRIREKKLEEEVERHRATISSLEEQKIEQKKHSLLSLEMADYEKTVTELSKKLELKEKQIRELESNLDTQRDLSKSLQEQILGLEARVSAEQHSADSAKMQANGLQDTTLELREEITSKEAIIADLERACEQNKLESERRALELVEISADRSKLEERARTLQETLSKEIRCLEDKLAQKQEVIERRNLELSELRQEFENYKVRAQSVLRQSQKDIPASRQHDMEEEVQVLRNTSDTFRTKLEDSVRRLQILQDENQVVTEEKNRLFQKVQELMAATVELRTANTDLLAAERRAKEEGEDNARLLRVQLDTLAQCYKKEIEELKIRHKEELDAAQLALADAETQLHLHVDTGHPGHRRIPSGGKISQTAEQSGHRRQHSTNFIPVKAERETLDVLMLEREACEGSESVDSTSPRLIPLDQLLSPQRPETDIASVLDRLDKSESRIQHLTDLLSDAESDAARLQQLNEVLKEEIRRKERNEAREQHAHNLEYLKNVVVKFSTLPRGDERLRLVPVLNTILKLSPEEEARLSNAARVGGEGNTWGSYLGGMWSTTQ